MTSPSSVPLGTGPPTREELIVHYPAKFTWDQLRTFINAGDLGLLKRDKRLQQRYDTWAVGIRKEYGSIVDYLTKYRLQWGRPDTLSKLKSTVDDSVKDLTTPPPSNPPKEWFTVDTPPEMISIIQNDWPYSVPADVEHTLIWTKLPIMHPTLIEPSIAPRIDQDGLCGFTGATTPPPPPDALPACLPALAEWGVTLESLIRSAPPSATEAVHIATAGREVHEFVRARWSEREWETAWFVNPQRLQSVPGLAHIHVFARRKSPTDAAADL